MPGEKAFPGRGRRRLGAPVRHVRRGAGSRERGDGSVRAGADDAHGGRRGDEDFVADAGAGGRGGAVEGPGWSVSAVSRDWDRRLLE